MTGDDQLQAQKKRKRNRNKNKGDKNPDGNAPESETSAILEDCKCSVIVLRTVIRRINHFPGGGRGRGDA